MKIEEYTDSTIIKREEKKVNFREEFILNFVEDQRWRYITNATPRITAKNVTVKVVLKPLVKTLNEVTRSLEVGTHDCSVTIHVGALGVIGIRC